MTIFEIEVRLEYKLHFLALAYSLETEVKMAYLSKYVHYIYLKDAPFFSFPHAINRKIMAKD